jgi:hypothetical protein
MNGVTQHAEVSSTQELASVGSVVVQDASRIDEVGEEHRHHCRFGAFAHGQITTGRRDSSVR